MENPSPHTSVRQRIISSEALVTVILACVVGVGAFAAMQTALSYDEQTIEKLEARILALEERERKDRDLLVGMDHRMVVLHNKVDRVLTVLTSSLTARNGTVK